MSLTTDTGTTEKLPRERFCCFARTKNGDRCMHSVEVGRRYCSIHHSYHPGDNDADSQLIKRLSRLSQSELKHLASILQGGAA